MEQNKSSLILGIIALVLEAISFFVFGWLSIIGLILGIVGACLPASTSGEKVPAFVSIPVGILFAILWVIALAALH